MKIELTIKVDYLPEWGLLEGVRELLQNAKDAEVEFSAPMTVRVRTPQRAYPPGRWNGQARDEADPAAGQAGTLVIENDGCTLPYESLLLGHSSKVERSDLIGKFGEGLKLGILAILRAGHSVKIRNGSEVWIPEIVHSEKFDARVLAFDIQKGRKEDRRIAIEIGGISPEYFQDEIKPRFLWLASERETARVKTQDGSLLLEPGHKGRVFVKGILVETKPDLSVGYDLDHADVDRDRRMVNSFDFSWKARCIWSEAMRARPDLFDSYLAIVDDNGPEAKNVEEYSAARFPKEFLAHVAAKFVERHGARAIPVGNIGESQDLEHMGRTGIIVNAPMRALLEATMGTLATVQEALRNEVVGTYAWSELSAGEQANLTRAVKLVNAVTPVLLTEINVVDFRSDDLHGTYSADGIKLSASVVGDSAACLRTLVHEVAHRSGGDGEKNHVAEIERIWSAIVQNLTVN